MRQTRRRKNRSIGPTLNTNTAATMTYANQVHHRLLSGQQLLSFVYDGWTGDPHGTESGHPLTERNAPLSVRDSSTESDPDPIILFADALGINLESGDELTNRLGISTTPELDLSPEALAGLRSLPPLQDDPHPYVPNICCTVCGHGPPMSEPSVLLTRWTIERTGNDSSPIYHPYKGSVVCEVCWNCVDSPSNQSRVIRCDRPPLLELEKISITQYIRRVRSGVNAYHSEPSPPMCMECHRNAPSLSNFVLVVLTTERKAYELVRPDRPFERYSLMLCGKGPLTGFVSGIRRTRAEYKTRTEMRDLVDVGVVCGPCAEENWGQNCL